MSDCNLINNNCLDAMRQMPENSIDSIVTDPPYGLSFMGKKWDYDIPCVDIWMEMLRVIKPGGHILSFGGSRTYHRMVVNIEDAGFEVRDCIMWIYSQGFPKSLNVGQAVNKIEVNNKNEHTEWNGWGTGLKPAHEPICLARKPLSEKSVALNVLKYSTGAVNIDECRVATDEDLSLRYKSSFQNGNSPFTPENSKDGDRIKIDPPSAIEHGRFPSNVIHDGSDEVLSLFPITKSGGGNKGGRNKTAFFGSGSNYNAFCESDSGSAARFFYCSKPGRSEKDFGVENWNSKLTSFSGGGMTAIKRGMKEYKKESTSGFDHIVAKKNFHPTVKPIDLMKYLCRLITPKNGIVLDPFCGSGTTGIAAVMEGFNFIGIEKEKEYIDIAQARINKALARSKKMF